VIPVLALLTVIALVLAIVSGTEQPKPPKVPLWIAVLLLCIVELLRLYPFR
jgi:hypothetical protein